MKYYTITVNGVAYSVSVEETAAGAAPVAAAPAAPAPAAAPKPEAPAAPAAPAAPKAPAGLRRPFRSRNPTTNRKKCIPLYSKLRFPMNTENKDNRQLTEREC